MANAVVSSGLRAAMGRKPSKNPLSTLISFRIDSAMTKALDAEVETELAEKPGLLLGRGDMTRMLMAEALAARAARRTKRSK